MMHVGLEVRDVLKGNMPLYLHALMQAKPDDKKKTLQKALRELAESEDDAYVDLTLTCVRKDDTDQKILDGVPPIRVWF